jgi:hypothetical protein
VSLQKGLNIGNSLVRLPKEDGVDAQCASGYPSMHGSESVEHSFPQQWKASLPISLPFDQFQLGDVALHYAVIDPPSKPSPHRLFVFLDSCGKGLQFRDSALVHLVQPAIKALSQALTQHAGELLDEVISQIHFAMELTVAEAGYLVLQPSVFRVDEETGIPLVVQEEEVAEKDSDPLDFSVLLEASERAACRPIDTSGCSHGLPVPDTPER